MGEEEVEGQADTEDVRLPVITVIEPDWDWEGDTVEDPDTLGDPEMDTASTRWMDEKEKSNKPSAAVEPAL